jgi:anti-sigma factor RsiW
MHIYLDGDLRKDEERELRRHLETCDACQKHFHELSRTITLIQSVEQMEAPVNFSKNVMQNLPTEKSHIKYTRWFKKHPVITVAAVFFLFLFSSIFSMWNRDSELVVSKQDNLIIKGDTVIVPEGVTVEGDLFVKNGNLQIKGQIDGNVTLINGKLIIDSDNTDPDDEHLLANSGVNGELKHIDDLVEWIWYNLKKLFENIFSFNIIPVGLSSK